jgi:hypothetical protein
LVSLTPEPEPEPEPTWEQTSNVDHSGSIDSETELLEGSFVGGRRSSGSVVRAASSDAAATGFLDNFGRTSKGGGGFNVIVSGLFGGVNQGSSASAAINTAKLEILAPDKKLANRQAFFAGVAKDPNTGSATAPGASVFSALAGGASTKSIFSYANGFQNLSNLRKL